METFTTAATHIATISAGSQLTNRIKAHMTGRIENRKKNKKGDLVVLVVF